MPVDTNEDCQFDVHDNEFEQMAANMAGVRDLTGAPGLQWSDATAYCDKINAYDPTVFLSFANILDAYQKGGITVMEVVHLF
jgi:hypothetical protein